MRLKSASDYSSVTSEEWAYAAGLMDGEGSISIKQSSGRKIAWRVEIRISNTDREMVEWMKERFCGTVHEERASRIKRGWKPIFTWTLCGSLDGRQFLRGILPYSITKSEQSRLTLEFWEGYPIDGSRSYPSDAEKNRRCDIVERMRKLKAHNHKCKPLIRPIGPTKLQEPSGPKNC